jgi:hypothetical protein
MASTLFFNNLGVVRILDHVMGVPGVWGIVVVGFRILDKGSEVFFGPDGDGSEGCRSVG